MSELVERVACAIYESAPFSLPGDFATAPPAVQECLREQARAAIGAMIEPSNSMVLAGQELVVRQTAVDEATLWRAMAAAALDGQKAG